MDKLVSVIIPVYNAEKYLDICLNSVLENTYKNLEIILVNDGSKDGSKGICDKYAKNDSRFVVIHKENGGTAAARNTALKIAKGDYIAFLDNDDYISPFFYEYMVRAIETTGADVVVCETTRRNEPQLLINQCYVEPIIVDKKVFIKGTYTDNWTRNTTPWNKLYKKELFEKIRFPEGKGYEDAYTIYRLIYESQTICYLNNTLYCWYQNEESYSSKKDNARKLLFREEAIKEQMEFYDSIEYANVKYEAIRFYMNELFFMIWQLDHDYIQTSDTVEVRNGFMMKLKRIYRKYYRLLNNKDRIKILEYIHPIYGMIYRKLVRVK